MWISNFEGFYFSAFRDTGQLRLFAFDHASGTHVKVESPDGGGFTPYEDVFIAFDQVLVTGVATDPSDASEYGYEVWSIGPDRELTLFSDVRTGSESAFPQDIAFLDEFPGMFIAEARWDSTTYEQAAILQDGTAMLWSDFFTDFETITDFGWITEYEGKTAYIAAVDGSDPVPWVLDTETSTVMPLADFAVSIVRAEFKAMYDVGGELYALIDDHQSSSWRLWHLNSDEQWERVTDATTGENLSAPWLAFELAGTSYFMANSSGYGKEIYKLVDDTSLERVTDIAPGSSNSFLTFNSYVFGEYVYFSASNYNSNYELYRMDSDENVELFAEIVPGNQGSNPQNFVEFDGRLFFTVYRELPDGPNALSLFAIDENHEMTEVSLPGQRTLQEIGAPLQVFDGNLYIFASDDDGGISTWVMAPGANWQLVAELPYTSGTLRNVHSWQIDMEGRSRDVYFGDDTDEEIIGPDAGGIVYARGGNDTVITGSRADRVDGGAGDDEIDGGDGIDYLDGGDDTDTAAYGVIAAAADVVNFGDVALVFVSETDRDHLTGIETLGFADGDVAMTDFPVNNPYAYLAGYGDLLGAYGSDTQQAIAHYFDYGHQEGRSLDLFNEYQFLASNTDLIGMDPLQAAQYYVETGVGEGRPTDAFDEYAYLASYDDLLNVLGPNPDAASWHYVTWGYAEGRSTDLFDEYSYLASYSDLLNAFGSNTDAATWHYVNWGYAEGRAADAFDEWMYLASNEDLIASIGEDGAAATQHYVETGYGAGLDAASFNAEQYLANYTDLQAAFGDNLSAAAWHFVAWGYDEGRTDDILIV